MEANSGDDEDYVEHPLTRDVQPASRAGAHVRERIEQGRAAQRERRQRMQATERQRRTNRERTASQATWPHSAQEENVFASLLMMVQETLNWKRVADMRPSLQGIRVRPTRKILTKLGWTFISLSCRLLVRRCLYALAHGSSSEVPDPIRPEEVDTSIRDFRQAFSGQCVLFGCAACGVRVCHPSLNPSHLLFKLRDLVVLRVPQADLYAFTRNNTLPFRSLVRVTRDDGLDHWYYLHPEFLRTPGAPTLDSEALLCDDCALVIRQGRELPPKQGRGLISPSLAALTIQQRSGSRCLSSRSWKSAVFASSCPT